MTNTVDIVLASKGGVGKSMISRFLTEHMLSRGIKPQCIDLDASNPTFASYEAFGAKNIEIRGSDHDINPRAFDTLVDMLVAPPEIEGGDKYTIVDVGTSTFIPLISYMFTNDVLYMLQDMGLEVRFQIVIAGGADFLETVAGFNDLCINFENVPVFLWQNHHFGEMAHRGVSLQQHPVFKAHKKRIQGMITIPERNSRTYGVDVRKMLTNFHTFDEVRNSDQYNTMEKHRLGRVWTELNENMSEVNL